MTDSGTLLRRKEAGPCWLPRIIRGLTRTQKKLAPFRVSTGVWVCVGGVKLRRPLQLPEVSQEKDDRRKGQES